MRLIICAVLGSAVCGGIGRAQENPPVDFAPRMQALIQSYLDSKIVENGFMGSVLVAQGDRVLFSHGYGFADIAQKIPDTPDTEFRVGSITKQFTAAGILLLEERGELSLNDPVTRYLPDAPPEWSKISIFNLLTHTSGIPNYTGPPDSRKVSQVSASPAELVTQFEKEPLEFRPGSKYKYSNSGYITLGCILERVSGMRYAEFLQKNIFGPLGMTATGVAKTAAAVPGLAHGYAEASTPSPVVYDDATWAFSAGAIYSTTSDLLKWECALFAGRVVSPASLHKMTTAFKSGYALGLTSSHLVGHRAIWHDGRVFGFRASMRCFPDEKAGPVVIVVLSNLDSPAPFSLAGQLTNVFFGKPVHPAPLLIEHREVVVPEQVLSGYVGVYHLGALPIAITLEDGHLVSQAGSQSSRQLFPESKTRFYHKEVESEFEFHRKSPDGPVTSMTIYQEGQKIDAVKD